MSKCTKKVLNDVLTCVVYGYQKYTLKMNFKNLEFDISLRCVQQCLKAIKCV